jgi:DNA-binding transcriptional regulator YiaG
MAGSEARAMLVSRNDEREEVLPEHAAPEEVIRALLDRHELTQDELARMIGVDERSIRRWATSGESVSVQATHTKAIDDLRHLQSVLGPSLPRVQFARWLRARNRQLGGERPVDLIADNRYQEVLEAATAFADGIFS